ncbi:cardiolipin synthase ClsB [Candidimonas nitroreducens]|uniref:Cardiolipin synthase B n=1 Tax=Candidimonas nitroreducens TaxID=683354 RepID=A0A225MRJ4_9BURK|nr:cardiolipin synthase ClsB [Candidimonas nitroreducens]OWT63835.1 cardiolipin synthase B [Candidimonas nitroreducens]
MRSRPHLHWYEGNRIQLLRNGGQFFPALCAAIDAAQSTVHLETYIFNIDRTGLRVLDHLQQACARGVKVRVAIDGFGSLLHEQQIGERLLAAGAQFRVYRPEPQGLLRLAPNPRRLRRLHRKTAVVDGRVAFVGGINILDDYEDVPDDGAGPRPRLDYAVQVEGPLVAEVVAMQNSLWLRLGWRGRRDWAYVVARLADWRGLRLQRRIESATRYASGVRAALVLRDNVRHRQTIERVYLHDIGHARREVVIANAYFFPGRRLRHALERAAARGVRVRLLLQGRSEYPMQYRASRYLYGKILDDGIEIYEYQPSYLHAKVAVIDDSATVGSSNLDPFSLLLAREANVFVDDAGFARTLQEQLAQVMRDDALQVTGASLLRRGWPGRCVDAVSYLVMRIAVTLTGRSSMY